MLTLVAWDVRYKIAVVMHVSSHITHAQRTSSDLDKHLASLRFRDLQIALDLKRTTILNWFSFSP